MSAKHIAAVSALSALLLAILGFSLINSSGQVTEVTGTVIAPFDQPDYAARLYSMRVALASGQEVRVRIPRTIPVRTGEVVVLSRRKSPLGTATYQFARYPSRIGE